MNKYLLIALVCCGLGNVLPAQNLVIQGKVLEEETKEPVIFGTVALFRDTVLLQQTETDFDGNYFFQQLTAGTYSVEFRYLGLETTLITDINLLSSTPVLVNAELAPQGVMLEQVVVISYRVPLIEQDHTTQGGTITSQEIRALPTRNINGLAATTAGLSQSNGDEVSVRGSRDAATNYYVDGVRVQGNLMPTTKTTAAPQTPAAKTPQAPAVPAASPTHDPTGADEFSQRNENPYHDTAEEAFSTFGVDVDRAAYSIVRTMLNRGQMPPAEVVRTEEMINYFEYDYLRPEDEHPFAVHSELATCPWNAEHLLLSVALQGVDKRMDELPPSNLTFLLDVSGSMGSPNKLPLVKQSIEYLVERLRPEDRVSLVVYAGAAGVVLEPTLVVEKQKILDALTRLKSGGSTAGGAGIRLAYELAREYFIEDGNNRVILATDGDFNVGVNNVDELETLITEEKESGVFLTTLGFGMGNLKDNKLERLADKGNGMYAYIDTPEEARKVFGQELTGSLYTIAKDVKLQLEFSPDAVQSYRLIGYENRLLAKEDFDDDTKDAGEIGAGHSVTAIYEIVPHELDRKDLLVGRLELRYKQPDEEQSQLMVHELSSDVRTAEAMSCNFRWATAIAAYSQVLQNSAHKGNADLKLVRTLAEASLGDDPYGIRQAFLNQLLLTEELAARMGVR